MKNKKLWQILNDGVLVRMVMQNKHDIQKKRIARHNMVFLPTTDGSELYTWVYSA